jgi:predicted site-specific integrase-resolvase
MLQSTLPRSAEDSGVNVVFLEPADAAKVLDRTPATVRDYADSGRLPVAARTVRGLRLFRREDVEKLRTTLAGGA